MQQVPERVVKWTEPAEIGARREDHEEEDREAERLAGHCGVVAGRRDRADEVGERTQHVQQIDDRVSCTGPEYVNEYYKRH